MAALPGDTVDVSDNYQGFSIQILVNDSVPLPDPVQCTPATFDVIHLLDGSAPIPQNDDRIGLQRSDSDFAILGWEGFTSMSATNC